MGETVTMAEQLTSFLANVTTTVTSLQTIVEGWLDYAMETPALFVFIVGIPIVGFGIGLLQRLFNLN